ncbi:MAG: hypothetical protein HZB35_07535 [Nitrospirae bacterium]|nr:hypothetical protein [Nitrospirota bacterium]
MFWAPFGWGLEANAVRPLLTGPLSSLKTLLPAGSHMLIETKAIEAFLDELDGAPPDWATVYGHGHHDPGHDDRLFNLNRERDAKREGNPTLGWLVTFVWPGELSGYDPKTGGFSVAMGPKFNPTRWGVVRFKFEDLPSNLTAVPNPSRRTKLRKQFEKEQKIEVHVVMTGRLIPTESIVYDFSHDQEGLGLIMPVVRIERVDYLLVR